MHEPARIDGGTVITRSNAAATNTAPPHADPPEESTDGAAIAWRVRWIRVITYAGMIVLGITPWARAQLDPPNNPAFCPPLTAFASPTLFDVFWGTTPIRFPFE